MVNGFETRKSPTVLIIDDDEIIRAIGRQTLESAEFTVLESGDGAEGISLIMKAVPDIVLLDVILPEMNGFEVCSALRSLPGGEHIPVLIMTGLDDIESINRAFEVGATDFVIKPINWMALIHHIRYVLRSSQVVRDLRSSEAKNVALLNAIPDLMFQIRRDGTFLDFKAPKETGQMLPFRNFPGRKVAEVLPADVARETTYYLEEAFRTKEMQIFEYGLSVEGVRHTFEARLAVSSEDRVMAIVRDITDRKMTEEMIRHLAYFDNLTNLPNRTYFKRQLDHSISHAKRHKGLVALFFLDLDNFKLINDTLGHAEGDQMLTQVAGRLTACVRNMDMVSRDAADETNSVVSRFGGDEFAIMLSEITCADDAAKVARRVLETLSLGFRLNGQDFFISASIGVALSPVDTEDADCLFRYADIAMYSAKEKGRNSYQFYNSAMNESSMEQLAIEHGLHRALEKNEFFLVYQPKLDITTGKIIGVEALIRWNHPEMGLLLPARFIPTAERNGLIVSIGEWVLHSACMQAKQWQMDGHPPISVAVNFSSLQVNRQKMGDVVRDVLLKTGLEPCHLELEVTESALMEHTTSTITMLHELKRLGVRIAIDDFGTGYSSLSSLKRFPLDMVKIDRSFVRDIVNDQDDAAITRAIIAMAHNLKLKVVAEGVEDMEQLSFLRNHGCDEAQGHLFSPPVSGEAIPEILKKIGVLPR
jgi:diguanylate cyclase (GGDEF)-like protein